MSARNKLHEAEFSLETNVTQPAKKIRRDWKNCMETTSYWSMLMMLIYWANT